MSFSGSNFQLEIPGFKSPENLLIDQATSSVTILGKRNLWVDTIELQDISEHLVYSNIISVNPLVTDTLEIVSTSDEDKIGGIGTYTVNIVYLDSNGIELNQDVTLNGLTPVVLPFNATAIQRMKATSGGSYGTSYGDIKLYIQGSGIVLEQISKNGNRSLSCRYKIPSNKKGFIDRYFMSAMNQSIDFRVRATVDEDTGIVSDRYHFKDIIYVPFNSSSGDLNRYIYCPPNTEIKVSGSLSSTSGSPIASVYLYLRLFSI